MATHPDTINVTSGTLSATAYLQSNSTYAGNTQNLVYCVKKGFGDALLAQYIGGRHYTDFNGYFSYKSSSVSHGRAYDSVTLVFTDNLAYSGGGMAEQSAAFETVYTAHCSREERPLELISGYRTKWNNDLYAFVATGGSIPSAPAWWDTATDKSNADGINWIWAQDMPSATDAGSWRMVKERTKVGVEAFVRPLPVVTETSYWSKQSKAFDKLQLVGKKKDPAQYSALANEWLVTDASVSEQDGYYIATVEYTGSNSWDSDLYEDAE